MPNAFSLATDPSFACGTVLTPLHTNVKECQQKLSRKLNLCWQVLQEKRSWEVKELMYSACADNLSSANKEARPSLDSSLVKKTTQFYGQDNNSRISAWKHDTIKVVMNGRKEAVQKRHFYVTLQELYQLFMEEYPYVSISHSKFAFLRPSHVLLNRQMPNRVYLCCYHENFIMLLETLCKVHPDIPCYSSQFVKTVVCAQSTEHC